MAYVTFAATALQGLVALEQIAAHNIAAPFVPLEQSGFQTQPPHEIVAPLAEPHGVRGSVFRSPIVLGPDFGVVDYVVDPFSIRHSGFVPSAGLDDERMVALPHDDRSGESLHVDPGTIGSGTLRGEGLGTLTPSSGVGAGVDEIPQSIVVEADGIAIVRFGRDFQILNRGTVLVTITPPEGITAISQELLLHEARRAIGSAEKVVQEAGQRQDDLDAARLFSDRDSVGLVEGAEGAFQAAMSRMQTAQHSLEVATSQAKETTFTSVFDTSAGNIFFLAGEAVKLAQLSVTRVETLLQNYADRAARELASLSLQKLRLRDAFVGEVRRLLAELDTLRPDETLIAQRNFIGAERSVIDATIQTADKLLSSTRSWYGEARQTVLSLIDAAITKIEKQNVSPTFDVYKEGYVRGWRDIRSLVEMDRIEGMNGAKLAVAQLQKGAKFHLETVVQRQREIFKTLNGANGVGTGDRINEIASLVRGLATRFEQGIAITEKQDKAARTGFAHLIDRQGQFVAWLTDRAVELSGDPSRMRDYYEYLGLAARAYRESVAEDSELLALREEIRASGINNADNIGAALFADYDRRRQLSEWMTLPPEQQGRGVFYDFRSEMQELGFDAQTIAEMPDRIPLAIRDHASADSSLLESSRFEHFVRLYDLGLRNDFLLPQAGEVLPEDEAIVLVFHGSGSSKSTVPSVASWVETLLKDFSGEGPDHKNSRRVTALGLGLPGHGYVTRDPRFFPADAREGTEADQLHKTMKDPEAFIRYIDAVVDRYQVYRGGETPKAIVLAGRSTGAFMVRVHRKIGDKKADLYLSMSAYRGGSQFWVTFDAYAVRYVARPKESPKGFDFFVGLTNSFDGVEAMPVSEVEGLSAGTSLPRVLNLAAGVDASYPPEIPQVIDKNDPVYQAWARRVAKWSMRYMYKYGRTLDEIYALLLDFADYYLAYLRVHPRRPANMTPQEFWVQTIRDQEVGFEDFWREDEERDPTGRLHFDPEAFHDMIALLVREDPNHETSIRVREGVRGAQNEEISGAIRAVRRGG